jgi:hypothetical protein
VGRWDGTGRWRSLAAAGYVEPKLARGPVWAVQILNADHNSQLFRREADTIGVSFKVDGKQCTSPSRVRLPPRLTRSRSPVVHAGEFPLPDITPPPAEEDEEQA